MKYKKIIILVFILLISIGSTKVIKKFRGRTVTSENYALQIEFLGKCNFFYHSLISIHHNLKATNLTHMIQFM